jgi:hypothetical protein
LEILSLPRKIIKIIRFFRIILLLRIFRLFTFFLATTLPVLAAGLACAFFAGAFAALILP